MSDLSIYSGCAFCFVFVFVLSCPFFTAPAPAPATSEKFVQFSAANPFENVSNDQPNLYVGVWHSLFNQWKIDWATIRSPKIHAYDAALSVPFQDFKKQLNLKPTIFQLLLHYDDSNGHFLFNALPTNPDGIDKIKDHLFVAAVANAQQFTGVLTLLACKSAAVARDVAKKTRVAGVLASSVRLNVHDAILIQFLLEFYNMILAHNLDPADAFQRAKQLYDACLQFYARPSGDHPS